MDLKNKSKWYSKNDKCDCLHRQYDKAKIKKNKFKKKVFKMNKLQVVGCMDNIYPKGTDMKLLRDNFVKEYKENLEMERIKKNNLIDVEDFLSGNYNKIYIK
jgi:hypothetical protein|tara:strand:+ start:425 stop:730 length:306 start_codon:yes stop_codon:yes gene_type:complete